MLYFLLFPVTLAKSSTDGFPPVVLPPSVPHEAQLPVGSYQPCPSDAHHGTNEVFRGSPVNIHDVESPPSKPPSQPSQPGDNKDVVSNHQPLFPVRTETAPHVSEAQYSQRVMVVQEQTPCMQEPIPDTRNPNHQGHLLPEEEEATFHNITPNNPSESAHSNIEREHLQSTFERLRIESNPDGEIKAPTENDNPKPETPGLFSFPFPVSEQSSSSLTVQKCPMHLSYADMKKYFRTEEGYCLGEGGFGRVYKGELRVNAVKYHNGMFTCISNAPFLQCPLSSVPLSSVSPFFSAPFLQCPLSSVPPFLSVSFLQCPLSSVSPFFNVPFLQCPLSSVTPFFSAPFLQCPLSSVSPFFNVPFLQCPLSSVSPFSSVSFLQCPLSLLSFYKVNAKAIQHSSHSFIA